jgi:hypothetical protein
LGYSPRLGGRNYFKGSLPRWEKFKKNDAHLAYSQIILCESLRREAMSRKSARVILIWEIMSKNGSINWLVEDLMKALRSFSGC